MPFRTGKQVTSLKYQLKLYVIGNSPNSIKAINNLTEICNKYLSDNYVLEVIDVYQQAEVARQEQIIALPLLVKNYPLPVRKLIGDMSQTAKVLNGLGLPAENE